MAKKSKKKVTRKPGKKHFKAPWWKLFFVVAIAVLISLPIVNKLDFSESVLGERTASDSSSLESNKKVLGRLVLATVNEFSGWACDRSAPDSSLTVEFSVSYVGSKSATVLGQAVANLPVLSNKIGSAAEKVCPGMTTGNNHRFSFVPSVIDTSKIAIVRGYILKDGEKIRLIESPRVIRSGKNKSPISSNSAEQER